MPFSASTAKYTLNIVFHGLVGDVHQLDPSNALPLLPLAFLLRRNRVFSFTSVKLQ